MNKKKLFYTSLFTLGLAALVAIVSVNSRQSILGFGLNGNSSWTHYNRREPTVDQLGIREYWAECGTGVHQFQAPASGVVTDKGTAYDLSEFTENDDRYIPYMMDEYHTDFSVYHYGAGETNLTQSSDYTYYVDNNSTSTTLNYKVYDQDNFKLDLPRVDFQRYNYVSMKFTCSNYHGSVKLGLSENDITYKDDIGTDRNIEGTVMFVLNGSKLKMALIFGTLSMSRNITDLNIISGKACASIYITGYYDRLFTISDVTFDSSNFVLPTYSFAQGAYGTGIYNITANDDVSWLMSQTREGETTTTTQLLYAGYDQDLMRFSLPRVDFELYNSVSMTLYVPAWNSNAKVGLVENDVNYTYGSGDNTFTGHLSFVYSGSKLIADLDFGTVHVTADVTDQRVIRGEASPLLFMKAYFNRQFVVRDFTVAASNEINLYNDWTINKMGAAMSKAGGDVTWGFATYTTPTVLGYKLWDVADFVYTLPKINFSLFTKVTMNISSTQWHRNVPVGLSSDDVTHYSTTGADGDGNITNISGQITFTYDGDELNMNFKFGDINISKAISDTNVINGIAGANIYLRSLYDRRFNLDSTKLSFVASEITAETSKIRNALWCGSNHFQNENVLRMVAEAGFDVIIGVNPTWHSNFTHILDVAESLGVSFIVDPRAYNSSTGNYDDWDGTCPSYASHPAVMGFIICDEPSTLQFSSLASMQNTFDAVMPEGKVCFINLLASSVSLTGLYGSEINNPSDYETKYANAFNTAIPNADLYAFDSYGLFDNGQIRKSYICNFDIWGNMSKNNNKEVWYTMISAGHTAGDQGGNYRYVTPTTKEFRFQSNLALTYGITNLTHYTFATTDPDYECMATLNNDGTFKETTAIFDDVSQVNHELKELDKVYSKYDYQATGTVHTGNKVNLLFQNLNHVANLSNYGVNNVTTSASDVVIGAFTDSESGERAYMVTNAGMSTDYTSTLSSNYRNYNANINYSNTSTTLEMTFANSYRGANIYLNGECTYVSLTNKKLTLSLDAYAGAFIVPVYY